MTEELKAKLREILEMRPGRTFPNAMWMADLRQRQITAIDQAYKEAGYLTERERAAYLRAGVSITYFDKPPLMTGQEWYDRFEKEMGDAAKGCAGCSCDAMMAAERASGLA